MLRKFSKVLAAATKQLGLSTIRFENENGMRLAVCLHWRHVFSLAHHFRCVCQWIFLSLSLSLSTFHFYSVPLFHFLYLPVSSFSHFLPRARTHTHTSSSIRLVSVSVSFSHCVCLSVFFRITFYLLSFKYPANRSHKKDFIVPSQMVKQLTWSASHFWYTQPAT